MKALTIKQPYASMIVNGYKKYEFRTWKTNYRGKLLIHASSNIDKNDIAYFSYLNINDYPTKQIIGECELIDCILIDEAQFLTREQVDQCMKVVITFDIPVICYGLRTDFLTNGFPGSTRLLEIAHTIEEMKTICRCGRKAIYNARFENGKFITKGSQVAIDGEKNITYISMCAKCYEKEKNKIDKN